MKYEGGTASVAEAVFWSALMQARAGMPCEFTVQYELRLEERRVIPDFAWPDARVLVEIDGRDWHTSAKAFTKDRQKDRLYLRNRWTCLRFAAGEVLGAGGAGMCAEELFATVGWAYPDVLAPAPDADLLHPLPAPEAVQPRGPVTETSRASTVSVRKRRWCT